MAVLALALAGAVPLAGQPAVSAVLYDTESVAGFAVTPPVAPLTSPLQTIDAVATGGGAVAPEALAGMEGIFINSQWRDAAGTQFAQIGTRYWYARNYLGFTAANANGVKTMVRFVFDSAGLENQFAGGFNSTGPRIVVASGQSMFLGAALDLPGGQLEMTFGSYTGSGTTEAAINFLAGPENGKAYAVQAVGFVVSGVAADKTVVAHFHGVNGQLLGTLEATSPGETAAGENAAGGELFFGYDAGADTANWVHRVVLSGETGGNAGFDDFGFTPVAVVDAAPVGPKYAGFPIVGGYINVPRLGQVYVGEAPWLYVWSREDWIYAPEEQFMAGGAWFFTNR